MHIADIVLLIHFVFVLFVVASLPVIWLGIWFNWSFIRNPIFRLTHLAAILFVVGESLIGITCPLTVWEHKLRGIESEQSFMQYWLHQILFYDFPEYVLTSIYLLFALLVLMTYKRAPPISYKKNGKTTTRLF